VGKNLYNLQGFEYIMAKEKIGKVRHYFDKISVAVIELTGNLKVGDTIEIGNDEENAFRQEVTSMEVDHNPVEEAKAGDEIGMKVNHPVKADVEVNKITED